MESGFEFELSNGRVIQVVPTPGVGLCSVSHGDTRIDITPSTGTFQLVPPEGKALEAIAHVVRFSRREFSVIDPQPAEPRSGNIHILKNCSMCGGHWCCVSGGCVNCGCGWTCGIES